MKKKNTQQNVVKKRIPYETMSIDELFVQTSSSIEGLSSSGADIRLDQNGKNEIPNKNKQSVFKIILKELASPIVILLLFAMVFSCIVGEWLDACVIFAIITIDCVMGTVQTVRAEKIATSLLSLIKTDVKVLRDGEKTLIDAKNIVQGDIVFLESGDKIPADLRIISCTNLKVDESLLTGESTNVEKNAEVCEKECHLSERTNMLFSGSTVVTGRAMAVVVETGFNTAIGNIANSLNQVQEETTPLKKRINKFSKQITFAIATVSIIMFVILTLQGNSFNSIFLFVIALAVSAIPESLPLAVTLALTIASNKMGKKHVVVKNLNAVESLGSCTVIASDKTGTLTLNQQTAKIIVLPDDSEFEITGSGYNDSGSIIPKKNAQIEFAKEIALNCTLNNEAKLYKHDGTFKSFGDSIDIAFLALGMKANVQKNDHKILGTVPYESEKKYSAVFYEENKKTICTAKGSIEKILSLCSKMKVGKKQEKLDQTKILRQHEKYARKGFRLIAVASAEFEGTTDESSIKNLTFLGFVGFVDPVRQETKPAVEACKNAGIKVLMITGDHPLTALAIAKDIGIAGSHDDLTTGTEIAEVFAKGEKAFDKFIKTKTVFSRVTPNDKLNIIESLKRQGEFVAVTGDGVNDAPAIKSAHIGIAMGSGTDVAKETSDMILTDNNFNSIVNGIKEGRTAYSNIRKVTYMVISQGIAELLFFFASVCFGLPLPLLAIQILYLNVITNGLQDIALSFEKTENGIMLDKPRPTKESLFSKSLIAESLVAGLTMAIPIFAIWVVLNNANADLTYSRSLIMALMVFMQNLHTINCRSETKSIFKIKLSTNWFVVISIFVAIILQVILMEVPFLANALSLTSVTVSDMLIMFATAIIILVVMEIYKIIYRDIVKHKIKKSAIKTM